MADISKIKLPSGTEYNLKDQGARDLIAELFNYTRYLGVTTTPLTDGATTNPITINGSSVTAENGDVVTYNKDEFIFNGTVWQKFGSLSGLGALAYKDTASGNFTPAGTVSTPTITVSLNTASIGSASGWSAGSVPTLGTAIAADDITAWSAGSVTTASVTSGVLNISTGTASSLSYTARSIPNVTSVGTAPSLTVISTTVATSVKTATSTQPTFTGTAATITSS